MKAIHSVTLLVGSLLLILGSRTGDGHRILGLFPFNAKSHFMMFEQLMKGLVQRGHQVDIVSHFPLKGVTGNYTYISLEGTLPNVMNNMTYDIIKEIRNIKMKRLSGIFGGQICELLKLPQLQNLIKNPPNDPPYDLVITENFVYPCYFAFGRHLKVPIIAVMTSVGDPWMATPMGNPNNNFFSPMLYLNFDDRMNFWQRLVNVLMGMYINIQFRYYTASQEDYVKKYIDPNLPGIPELERDVALLLINSHPSLNSIKAYNPSIIEVGGLHLMDDSLKLSPEMKKWLDDSKDGCIYFSVGSMIKIESFPKDTLAEIYLAFKKIAPIRVLMKVTKKEELPSGLPKNVMTGPWFPQFQILQHKNIRAFITHGGLLSTQESIYHAVPMIGMPLFGDQHANIQNYVKKKIAVSLDYENITEEALVNAVHIVMKDPSYKKNIVKVSTLFRDRPISALDLGIYWVEYVIRNGYALKAPSADLEWWQIASIDIFVFVFSCMILITLYIVRWILIILYRLIFTGRNNASKIDVSNSKKNK